LGTQGYIKTPFKVEMDFLTYKKRDLLTGGDIINTGFLHHHLYYLIMLSFTFYICFSAQFPMRWCRWTWCWEKDDTITLKNILPT